MPPAGSLAQIAPDLLGKGQARQGLGIGRIDLEGPAIAVGGLVDPPRLGQRPGEIAMGHGQPGRQIHGLAQRGDGGAGRPAAISARPRLLCSSKRSGAWRSPARSSLIASTAWPCCCSKAARLTRP